MSKQYEKKYDSSGRVAVLVSPGYGAGWSTWAPEDKVDQMLFDSRLVDLALDGAKVGDDSSSCKVECLLSEIFDAVPYTGGWDSVKVHWLTPGTRFRIDEYDGSEALIELDYNDFTVA